MAGSTREHEVVAAAVGALPDEHRRILVEAYFRGRSARDAARVLGLPVPVVKVRVYEALRHLHRILAAEGVRPRPGGARVA